MRKFLIIFIIGIMLPGCLDRKDDARYHWEVQSHRPGSYKILYSTNKDENILTDIKENEHIEIYAMTYRNRTNGRLYGEFNDYIKFLKIYNNDTTLYDKNNPPETDWELDEYKYPQDSGSMYGMEIWYRFIIKADVDNSGE